LEPVRSLTARVELELNTLQREAFSYFEHEVDPANGLVKDKTVADRPASIAATGFALAAYPIAVERGFISRAAAVERTLNDVAVFLGKPTRSRARRDRIPGILLSLSRDANRASGLGLRALNGRHGLLAGRNADGCGLLRIA
jgi:hypothetical protein